MKIKNCMKFFLVFFVVFQLSGCASIVSKSDYPVSFNSTPNEAIITVTDLEGKELYKGTTPTQVTLKSGNGFFKGAKYNVKLEKEGCEPQTMVLEKRLDGWYWGNILFGGLVGILIVDPATGAMWKLPEEMKATLTEKTTALVVGQDSMKMALLDDVPESVQSKMVKIQ